MHIGDSSLFCVARISLVVAGRTFCVMYWNGAERWGLCSLDGVRKLRNTRNGGRGKR